MVDFLMAVFDLCFSVFSVSDNIIVFVPVASIAFMFILGLVNSLIRGRFR